MRFITYIPLKLKKNNNLIDLKSGDIFIPDNPDAIKHLLANGHVKPVKDAILDEYKAFFNWLKQYDLTIDEIKEYSRTVYQELLDCVSQMDGAYDNEDLTKFHEAKARIVEIYLKAVKEVGEDYVNRRES